jgi:hypothetical protein
MAGGFQNRPDHYPTSNRRIRRPVRLAHGFAQQEDPVSVVPSTVFAMSLPIPY